MNEKESPVTTEKQAERPIRLRVDTSGLSEETRRELGLAGEKDADQNFRPASEQMPAGRRDAAQEPRPVDPNRAGRAGGDQTIAATVVDRVASAPGLARELPIEQSEARRVERPEPARSSEVFEQRSPGRAKAEGSRQNEERTLPHITGDRLERDPAGKSQDFDKYQDAAAPAVGKKHGGSGDRVRSQDAEHIYGVEERRKGRDQRRGNPLSGEGYKPTLAEDSTLRRPGRARSGAEVNSPDGVPGLARELPPSITGHSATGAREENERWQALQLAVKQNLAHHQQTHAAMVEALRDSTRLQAAQRAELDRLAAQVRTLLAQNESAGFNRQ